MGAGEEAPPLPTEAPPLPAESPPPLPDAQPPPLPQGQPAGSSEAAANGQAAAAAEVGPSSCARFAWHHMEYVAWVQAEFAWSGVVWLHLLSHHLIIVSLWPEIHSPATLLMVVGTASASGYHFFQHYLPHPQTSNLWFLATYHLLCLLMLQGQADAPAAMQVDAQPAGGAADAAQCTCSSACKRFR